MKLHDVAVTPDGQRLFGVGPLLESKDHLKPSKPRSVEKRLAGTFAIMGRPTNAHQVSSIQYYHWNHRAVRSLRYLVLAAIYSWHD